VRSIKRLKHERQAHHKISQQAVEQATGIPQSVISFVESGRLIPTPKQLNTLADFFGIPADELLKDVVVLEPTR
jgi:transcriptional regulator with XRE-family HTH domain